MIALVQRVTQASVEIDGRQHAMIGAGMLALVCAEKGDTEREADLLADKTVDFRMFQDQQRRMNLSLIDASLALLVVPQFTLAANTESGRRASFTPAAAPDIARVLFERFVAMAAKRVAIVKVGVFAADMKVGLINDGPVTFWLRIPPAGALA
jgi:D-tyrosyl-tRNA(Tyr) deacylase